MSGNTMSDPSTLRRVLDAVLLIEADLELPVLLRHVTEEACAMTGARYGALGVLDESRTHLAEFITVGLEADQEEEIAARPTGQGVLGLLVANPEPLRLSQLSAHEESFGFPPGHPPMTSFLGVPIKVRDEVFGNLYLTDKIGWNEFTREDEALVTSLAVAAGIAIENARLHQLVQEHAVSDDRERVARDLHDTVIQTLYGAGLSLQGIAGAAQATDVSDQMNAVAATIDDAISPAPLHHLRAGADRRRTWHPGQDHLALARTDRRRWLRGAQLVLWAGGLGHLRCDRRATSGHCPRGGHQRRSPCSGHPGQRPAQCGERRVPAPGHRQRARAGTA